MCERDCCEVIPGLQLSHVGGDQAAPVSTLCVELLEAETLHQFVENASGTNCIKPCPDPVKGRHECQARFLTESPSGATRVSGGPHDFTVTFLMRCFGEAVTWNGGADHLKDQVTWVGRLGQQRNQPVELVEGAGPTVHHDQRDGSRTLGHLLGLHMEVVDINACRDDSHMREGQKHRNWFFSNPTVSDLQFWF